MSPTSSQMQKVEPSSIVSCGKSAPYDAVGARLGQGFDDVPTVADMRQAEAGHPEQSVDVGFQHRVLIFFGRLPKGIAPEAEAGVVDEDVEAAELADRGLDEPLAALSVGDVELELDLRLQLVDAAGAACAASALARERGPSRRAA